MDQEAADELVDVERYELVASLANYRESGLVRCPKAAPVYRAILCKNFRHMAEPEFTATNTAALHGRQRLNHYPAAVSHKVRPTPTR